MTTTINRRINHGLFVFLTCCAVVYIGAAALMWLHGYVSSAFAIVISWMGVCLAIVTAMSWRRERRAQRAAMARLVGDRLLSRPQVAQAQGMVQRERTLWDAIHEWVLPHSYHPVDCNEQRTHLRLTIHVQLGWADRLRLLLCGQMRVLSTVYTDVEVKECSCLTNVEVHPFTVGQP